MGPASHKVESHLALRRFLPHIGSLDLLGCGLRGLVLGNGEGAGRPVPDNKWNFYTNTLINYSIKIPCMHCAISKRLINQ